MGNVSLIKKSVLCYIKIYEVSWWFYIKVPIVKDLASIPHIDLMRFAKIESSIGLACLCNLILLHVIADNLTDTNLIRSSSSLKQ